MESVPFSQYLSIMIRIENCEKALDKARGVAKRTATSMESQSIEQLIIAIDELKQGIKDREMRRIRS